MDETKTIAEWVDVYADEKGVFYNAQTLRKRRFIAQEKAGAPIGRLVPPKTYLLTRAEFETVINTPLPGSTRVIHGSKKRSI